jgi:lipopolysaccharide transport protein LptA
MRKLMGVCAVLSLALVAGPVHGQGSAPSTLSPRAPASPAEKSPAEKPKSDSTAEPAAQGKPSEKAVAEKPKESAGSAAPKEAMITEIFADEATFDSTKSIGIFTGKVVVTDPRFKVQGDKLTIYLGKKQNDGLEKAVVEGNVGVVRDRPAADGAPPDRMVGRAEKAVYTAKDGNFELTGNPRVQQGMNTHVATSPDTVMILNEIGQLQTKGPSRTEIRQEPKSETTPKP